MKREDALLRVERPPWSNFEGWVEQVPQVIKQDSLWTFQTYRLALHLADLAWFDAGKLLLDARGKTLGWQLIRSAGSIAANIEEGHGRGFGKDNGRFQTIALGSAKETRGWHYRSRHILDPATLEHRLTLTSQIISGLVKSIPKQRKWK